MESDNKKEPYININAGGNIDNVHLIAGNHNKIESSQKKIFLPNPDSVDIQKEIQSLRNELSNISTSDQKKIDNALEEASDEVAKNSPDTVETGKAIERALTYAKKADEFNKVAHNLLPTITKVVAWLGKEWYNLLKYFPD